MKHTREKCETPSIGFWAITRLHAPSTITRPADATTVWVSKIKISIKAPNQPLCILWLVSSLKNNPTICEFLGSQNSSQSLSFQIHRDTFHLVRSILHMTFQNHTDTSPLTFRTLFVS